MKPEPQTHTLMRKHLEELGITHEAEYKFHPDRRWRADFALWKLEGGMATLVEIEGGIWSRGRHTRGKGYQADLEKYNTATAMGYRVLRFSSEDVLTGRAKEFLAEHVK